MMTTQEALPIAVQLFNLGNSPVDVLHNLMARAIENPRACVVAAMEEVNYQPPNKANQADPKSLDIIEGSARK